MMGEHPSRLQDEEHFEQIGTRFLKFQVQQWVVTQEEARARGIHIPFSLCNGELIKELRIEFPNHLIETEKWRIAILHG